MSDMDFDAWLEGASPLESSVDVYPDGKVFGEFQAWEREYERLTANAERTNGERSAGEVDPVAECEARGEALLERMKASRTTVFLRGISMADEEAVNAQYPLPDPVPGRPKLETPALPDRPSSVQADAFLARVQQQQALIAGWEQEHAKDLEEYAIAVSKVLLARGVEKLQRAFVRMEQGGRVLTESMSVEQLKKFAARIGEVQLGELISAVDFASKARAEVPGDSDFLSRRSGSGQDL